MWHLPLFWKCHLYIYESQFLTHTYTYLFCFCISLSRVCGVFLHACVHVSGHMYVWGLWTRVCACGYVCVSTCTHVCVGGCMCGMGGWMCTCGCTCVCVWWTCGCAHVGVCVYVWCGVCMWVYMYMWGVVVWHRWVGVYMWVHTFMCVVCLQLGVRVYCAGCVCTHVCVLAVCIREDMVNDSYT